MNALSQPPADLSFCMSDDGCKIAVRRLKVSAPSAPVIIMIHALAMDHQMWSDVAVALAVEANVYAVDCRGHGRSGKPAGPYDVELFNRDLLSVLEHLSVQRAVFVGCSMGGTVAIGMAGRFPDRVAGLIAIDTTAWYGEDAPTRWAERGQKALSNGMAMLADFQSDRWFSAEFRASNPEALQRALDVFLINDTNAYNESCLLLGAADERHLLSRYPGPVHVIVGENDYATPVAMAMEITKILPQARLQIVPMARHYTPIETPEIVAANIDQLVSSL
ncbi:alpha/beta fold hydrolase [Pseudomonas synxantha]|nr:alpha/beta fold hydrolase [Pseudomonas synxantha]